MNAPGSYDQAAKQVAQLRREIDELRAFEHEYRTSLAAHLDELLATLKSSDEKLPLRMAVRLLCAAPDGDLPAVMAELDEDTREQFTKRLIRAMLLVPVPEPTDEDFDIEHGAGA